MTLEMNTCKACGQPMPPKFPWLEFFLLWVAGVLVFGLIKLGDYFFGAPL